MSITCNGSVLSTSSLLSNVTTLEDVHAILVFQESAVMKFHLVQVLLQVILLIHIFSSTFNLLLDPHLSFSKETYRLVEDISGYIEITKFGANFGDIIVNLQYISLEELNQQILENNFNISGLDSADCKLH